VFVDIEYKQSLCALLALGRVAFCSTEATEELEMGMGYTALPTPCSPRRAESHLLQWLSSPGIRKRISSLKRNKATTLSANGQALFSSVEWAAHNP